VEVDLILEAEATDDDKAPENDAEVRREVVQETEEIAIAVEDLVAEVAVHTALEEVLPRAVAVAHLVEEKPALLLPEEGAVPHAVNHHHLPDEVEIRPVQEVDLQVLHPEAAVRRLG